MYVILQEAENKLKHQIPNTEIPAMWNMKCSVIPGSLGRWNFK
jgi:hypothetical protein